MTNQNLLSKLATKCATWREAKKLAEMLATKSLTAMMVWQRLTEQSWLAERERLLDKPDWCEAPAGANYLAMDADGSWFFYENEPVHDIASWQPADVGEHWAVHDARGVPAGYDWRKSIEMRPSTS